MEHKRAITVNLAKRLTASLAYPETSVVLRRIVQVCFFVSLVLCTNVSMAVAPCNLEGVPAKSEADKPYQFTVTVKEGNGTPIFGAEVYIGDAKVKNTNSDGIAEVAGVCGPHCTYVLVSVRRPGEGQSCSSGRMHCCKRDKSGDVKYYVPDLPAPGLKSYNGSNLIQYHTVLSYGGLTFDGPAPSAMNIDVNVVETEPNSGVFLGKIVNYTAAYPNFSYGPFSFGSTTVTLWNNGGNYLTIDTNSGLAFGSLSYKMQNNLIGSETTRHNSFQGTYDKNTGILDLSVCGFAESGIPTLSEWGLILLALLLLIFGTVAVMRRRKFMVSGAG